MKKMVYGILIFLLALALSFVAVYSIVEPRLCEIGFNPFMLVLGILVDYRANFLSLDYRTYKK